MLVVSRKRDRGPLNLIDEDTGAVDRGPLSRSAEQSKWSARESTLQRISNPCARSLLVAHRGK